jgi:hypothetical protein
MAVFRLKSEVRPGYLALLWSVALLLVGAYFLIISLWPPSLLILVWLAVALTGAFFAFRALRRVQDMRGGGYAVGLHTGAKGITVIYANGKAEAHAYGTVTHGSAYTADGVHSVTLETARKRYDFELGESDFAMLTEELKRILGSRFEVF